MEGRIEVEEKIERSICNKLNSMPSFASEWYLALRARGVTMKSCRNYVYALENFIIVMGYGDKLNVADIGAEDLAKYFSIIQYKTDHKDNKIRTSDAYRNMVWFALNNFFEYEYEVGNISKNYMKVVKPVKSGFETQKKKPILNADDFKKMLVNIPGTDLGLKKRNNAILMLYMTTGMRRDALCQMNISDIDFKKKEVTVIDKGEKSHTYKLTNNTMKAISEWLMFRNTISHGTTEAVFLTYQGKRITGNSVYNMITECSKSAFGTAISPHKIRSGLCSILYEQTHDIEFVRRAIGHSKVTTTQRYIITDGNERSVASQIIGELL